MLCFFYLKLFPIKLRFSNPGSGLDSFIAEPCMKLELDLISNFTQTKLHFSHSFEWYDEMKSNSLIKEEKQVYSLVGYSQTWCSSRSSKCSSTYGSSSYCSIPNTLPKYFTCTLQI